MPVTHEQINLALAKHGTNLCAWSRSNHYSYSTVRTAIKRWVGRSDRTPHGGVSRLVMKDLENYVNETLSDSDS